MSQVSIASSFFENNTTLNAGSSTSQMTTYGNSKYTFGERLATVRELTSRSDSTEDRSRKDQFEVQFKSKLTKTSQDTKKVDKSTKNDNVKEKQVNQKEEIDDDEKETKSRDEVTDQILVLISDALNVPVEEIQTQLEAMGLEIEDLLTEEGFGAFINELYAQGDMNALLSGEIDMKQIRNLFETLSDFKEEFKQLLLVGEEGNQSLEGMIAKTENQGNMTQSEMNQSLIEEVQNPDLVNEMTIQEVQDTVIQNVDFTKERSDEETMPSFVEDGLPGANDLGMTVPIHHFTTTTFTQTFQTENGMVTQMTTAKQVMGGKAFIEQVDFKVLSQTKELNLILSPKELGQMNIKIVEYNGTMTAEIKVDNEKAKAFILNEIHALEKSFDEQGLNVTNVKVDIRQDNHQSQMEQEKQKSSKRIQEIISKHMGEAEEEEEMIAPIASESEVDYMV